MKDFRIAGLGLLAAALAALLGTGCGYRSEPSDPNDQNDAGTDAGTDNDGCEGDVVVFPDAVLERCVRDGIGQPEGVLCAEAVAGLAEINPCDPPVDVPAGVADLEGAQYLVSLWVFNIYSSSISDIEPISELPALEVLVLEDSPLSDLSPLASGGLTSLAHLGLGLSAIEDISPLAGVPWLTELVAYYNGITDIAALAGLTQLVYLDLSDNAVTDIAPLAGLTELTWLYLQSNDIADLSPLVANAGIGDGDQIWVGDNPIDEVAQADNIAALCDRGVLLDPYCP